MTGLITEGGGADRTNTGDATDRIYVTDIQNGSIDRGPTVLIRVLARLRRFGFGVSPGGAGVLGFCSRGETLAVCYVDKRRVSAGSDYGPTDATGADFALADIEVSLASDPDGPSLYQRCERMFGLPAAVALPQAWVSTTVAKGAEVVVSTPGELRRALVFSAAQELGQFLSRAAADPADSRRGDNWLEQAKPQEPPIFDYRLLPTSPVPGGGRRLGHVPKKAAAESATARAQLWWMTGYEARGLLDQFQRHGLPVTGVTPDGVALYWGLMHLWQRSKSDLSPLRDQWALVEDTIQPSLWLYSGSWFQSRSPLDSLDAIETLNLDAQATIVLWLTGSDTAKNGSTQAFADSLSNIRTVYDNTLSRWSCGTRYRPPALDVSSVIALGSALQGSHQPSGDWQGNDVPPQINLLPWRGAWLQQRQGRLFCQLIAYAVLFSGFAYLWLDKLQRKADTSYQMLLSVRAEHDQIVQAQERAQARDHALAARRAALEGLAAHGAHGQRQLLNVEALLALLPECFVIHRIALAKNSVTVFGLASNRNRLVTLPEKLFAAFSKDQDRSLESWPVLLTGSDAATGAYAVSPDPSPASPAHGSKDNDFVLRVAFAPDQSGLSLKTDPLGAETTVE
jgi:Tfp pilus assembly protein PilN